MAQGPLGHRHTLSNVMGVRVAEWPWRSHRLPRAVLSAGLWVRVPSPIGYASLATTGVIGDCYSVDMELYNMYIDV